MITGCEAVAGFVLEDHENQDRADDALVGWGAWCEPFHIAEGPAYAPDSKTALPSLRLLCAETLKPNDGYIGVRLIDSSRPELLTGAEAANLPDWVAVREAVPGLSKLPVRAILALPLTNGRGFVRGVLLLVNPLQPSLTERREEDPAWRNITLFGEQVAVTLDSILIGRQLVSIGVAPERRAQSRCPARAHPAGSQVPDQRRRRHALPEERRRHPAFRHRPQRHPGAPARRRHRRTDHLAAVAAA